jgi:hypothetical protein
MSSPARRATAQQRLARGHLAEDRDAQVQRPGGGVAAHQFDAVRVGQRQHAAGQRRQEGLVGARQRQRQREGQRFGAAGGEVAQVDGQRLVAQPFGRHGGQEVPAFDQHVAGNGQLHARLGAAARSRRPHPARHVARGA